MAQAHAADLAVQGKYGVSYYRYWYDEATGKVFCLAEAPERRKRLRRSIARPTACSPT